MVKTGAGGRIDANGGGGFSQLLPVGMREQHDGFIAVIDVSVGEAGLVIEDELDVVLAGDVKGGDDREFRPVDAGIEVDGADETARYGAANCGAVPEALEVEIVEIARAAEQLVDALFARDGSADDASWGSRIHCSLQAFEIEA